MKTPLLVSALAATLPLIQAHNFWIAHCETQDLVNGINSRSVEFQEGFNLKSVNWYNAGTVCQQNKYRPWHRACIEGTFKSTWSYGDIQLTYKLKSDTVEFLPENVYFGSITAGGETRPCCKKNYKTNQWHDIALARNKVCNGMFYCGDSAGCKVDKSVLA